MPTNKLTSYRKEVNIMLGMKLTSFFSYMPNNLWENSQHCKKSLLGLSFCLSFSFYCISKTVCSVIAYIIFNRYLVNIVNKTFPNQDGSCWFDI